MSMIKIKTNMNTSKNKAKLLEMMNESTKMIRLNVNVPAQLHKDLKLLATQKDISMSEIVKAILFKYIQKEIKE